MNDSNSNFFQLIKKIRDDYQTFSNTKVRVAILGKSGTGKSTFINALAGKKIAKTNPIKEETGIGKNGLKDQAFAPICYSVEGIEFYDLPGFGTSNFPATTFLKDFDIKKSYDCILFMSSLRFNTESDLIVYKQILKSKITCFVVWTKFDETVRRAPKDSPELPSDPAALAAETVKQIKKDLQDKNLSAFVISDEAHFYDFTKLKQAIEDSLSEIQKKRFIQSVAAKTEKDLEKKREVAEDVVYWMSILAGVKGAVSDMIKISGMDLDVKILTKMVNDILLTYGFDQPSIKHQPATFSCAAFSQMG